MPLPKPLLQLTNLQLLQEQQTIISSLSLDINAGEFITLLGPSGCGKTSLLQLIGGFLTPDSGSITLNQIDITHKPPQQRNINTVFQRYALFPHLTVHDNIAFGLRCQRLPKSIISQRVHDALQLTHLEKYLSRYPHQLSGGQQQRVAIARAIVMQPDVLLLDEPLSALDSTLRQAMQQELKKLQKELGITFIFVTHDQQEALSLSDRIVVMDAGRILQVGTPRDIYDNPKSLTVARCIGPANVLFGNVSTTPTNQTFTTLLAGHTITLANTLSLAPGDSFCLVLRPEDIQVWAVNEPHQQQDKISLPGRISRITYQGASIDLQVELNGGATIQTTAFFDEDDAVLDYQIGETVIAEWTSGWEVLLRHE